MDQFYSDRTTSVAIDPTPATTTTTTTTTTPLFQNDASLRELQEALRIWLHEIDQTSFQSFAVFCEYKLRRSASQSSQWSSPNAFGTSVAWVCLMRAAESMPNYRGLFEALAQTIGPSIYCDYDQITTQLVCDGGENDAWTLFDSETYYQRSKTMEREINQLRDSLTMMLDSSKQLKTQLTAKTMFSALGMASETFNHSSNYAVTLLARTWKQRQPPQQSSNQGNKGNKGNNETGANGGTGTIATVKEKISDLETVMRSISSMTNKKLEIFMTDVASYRNEFVSVHLLTDFFGTAPASSRISFISIFWRFLHHTEKEQLLNTIPIRSRDKNLRETLENILLESGLPHPNRHRRVVGTNANETVGTTLETMETSFVDDGKQPEHTPTASRTMTDTTLITFVKHACQSATIANESESREFLHRMMCALEMLRVGEQQMKAASIDLPNDPQNAIESKARDIVRLWHVEQDKCQKLQLALNEVKEELQDTKTSVRTMARVQSKINEYNMSSSEIRSEENGVAVDLSIHGRKVVWPILHHTSHSRRHSLHRVIDCFYEEETLRTGGRSNPSTSTNTSSTTHHMSLEEIHSAIASFYNVALLSAGVGSQMYSMAEIMKLHLVCEYGEPHMAIAHCQRIDVALRNFYQTDQRCHLFAMLCGSVEANSFLNRPETSQFVVTALAHMMKASVLDGIASVQDMFEMSNENDVDGTQTNVFHCERAKMVVRNLFQMKGRNENNQLGEPVSRIWARSSSTNTGQVQEVVQICRVCVSPCFCLFVVVVGCA